jgi:hypothetical protein
MVVGETSDSFSMLLQSVSRGSVGSRCASGSETAAETEFANDCPSQTRMLLEHRHETRPTSRQQQQHASRPTQFGRRSTAPCRALPAPLCDVTAACRGAAGVYL